MREDGTVVSAGEQTSFDEDRAQVSGLWELDKFQGDPLKIYFIGTGSVSATVIEHNEMLPLADTAHPYEHTHGVFDSSTQQSASISDFYMMDAASKISVVLSCASGTHLNRIYGINNSNIHEYKPHTTNSLFEYVNPFANLTSWHDSNGSIKIDNNINGYTCRSFKTLSVYFTSDGILEYIPNKNTLNPDLR